MYIGSFQGKELYNLGLGDYNYRARLYSDDIITDNGDPYSVYHTVLATIPCFFDIDKHFENLTQEYEFFGSLNTYENQSLTEDYLKGKKYLSIYLKKRKFYYMIMPEDKKKLTPEERAKLLAEAMAAARRKDVFPESTAEAKRTLERIKNGKFAPGLKW